MQQGLGRDAADIEAGAAERAALVDAGDLQPELGCVDGGDIAARAAADDHQIVFRFAHDPVSPGRCRTRANPIVPGAPGHPLPCTTWARSRALDRRASFLACAQAGAGRRGRTGHGRAERQGRRSGDHADQFGGGDPRRPDAGAGLLVLHHRRAVPGPDRLGDDHRRGGASGLRPAAPAARRARWPRRLDRHPPAAGPADRAAGRAQPGADRERRQPRPLAVGRWHDHPPSHRHTSPIGRSSASRSIFCGGRR